MPDDSPESYTCCRYTAVDERTHDAGSAADYNESVYFNFLDTRAQIGGILRTGNRPGMGHREYSVNLKLPGGVIAFRAGREPSAENAEFRCGGLRLRVDEPTRTWHLTFSGSLTLVKQPARLARDPGRVLKSSPAEDVEIDLVWRATTPMFVLAAGGSGRATPGDTSLMGTDHYEQFGTVNGRIRIGSRTWELGGVPSMRDHSWGPRVWGSFEGEWLCGFLPDGTGMTLYSELQPSGRRAYSGAVVHGGRPHYVRSFDVSTTYDGGAQTEDRFSAVLQSDGLPTLLLDGQISHFAPLAMGTAPHRTRIASMVVTFCGGDGGGAFAEFLRPIPAE